MNKEEDVIDAEKFYQMVAILLKCDDHKYIEPYKKKTRWNNRSPGNGRYHNHGLIRYHNPSNIHVMLSNPKINGLYTSVDSVIDVIKKALDII